uniref:SAM domain-containing protein n=1 Tax=Astyanax mexicanus TaxID=7994 RepID=A0A8B9KQP8_ASTMX
MSNVLNTLRNEGQSIKNIMMKLALIRRVASVVQGKLIRVTSWLDDIGLPQYKDQFHEGRVDGRMLQYLTVNDLLILKVSSQLHHLSIKSAIHVLHVNKFNPNCLKRRPGDEAHIQSTPSEVMQWSNHRVMEWLRSVDLAEYAPNLRGSGVHGGLIILEPRFNSDTLAMLLNIPPQKTLLRRHLATNFASLVGAQAQQEKQEYVESAGYTPLSTTAKVRVLPPLKGWGKKEKKKNVLEWPSQSLIEMLWNDLKQDIYAGKSSHVFELNSSIENSGTKFLHRDVKDLLPVFAKA